MSTKIVKEVQKLETDALVSLYTIDTTTIGGTDVFNFTSMPNDNNSPVSLGGTVFTPIDIEATGFKWDGQGGFPKPRLRIANVGGLVTASIITYGDLVGSRFIRTRTFAKHLDGGSDPDPAAIFPQEFYTVNQRTQHNKMFVEWQLSSVFDTLGVMLPRRQCIRDVCTHAYRIYNPTTGTFDYSKATCPYTAGVYYTESNAPTAAPTDKCAKDLNACKLRFGVNAELPIRAFPGIGRV